MSAQMVDAYLDELLAPLAEDALAQSQSASTSENQTGNQAGTPTGIQADTWVEVEAGFEADFAAEAAAFAKAAAVAEAPNAPAPADPPAQWPEPESGLAPVPLPEPAIAAPVQPQTPPAPVPEVVPRSLPCHLPAATPQPSANQHGQAPLLARASHSTSGNRWLRAALGNDRYAFELLRVQEVVRMSPIIALRGTSTAMLGVMNLRGRIVPVFDLALWLGTGRVEPDEHARIIVVERDDELIGVLVSAVDDVVTLSREHIEPPLPGTDPGGVVGIARVSRLPTVLLDANALFE